MDAQPIMGTMEVLKTKPLTELLTEAIIKVCWVSNQPNQNHTVITREVGQEIAATLPGAPVAGLYDKDTGDFVQHSTRVTLRNGEFEIEDLTKAYGFVDPTVAPWYQDFEEGGVIRTYLMCKAYLWTKQYAEATKAIGKGQSMELNENDMSGYYSGDVFIFTSATMDKLCILGDNYPPCFAGAKILSAFSAHYEVMADELEKTLGRRYYVMDGKLTNAPKGPITLDYAVQLGWNLTDAVYSQLRERGAECKYDVQGIYAEGTTIFTILQDRTSLEFVRCEVTITSEDTVTLGSEMTRVKQTWAPQAPTTAKPVQPIEGSPDPIPLGDPTMNTTTASTPISGGGVPPSGFTAVEPAEPQNENTVTATEPAPAGDFTATEPTSTTEPVTDPADPASGQFAAKTDDDDEEDGKKTGEDDDDDDEKKKGNFASKADDDDDDDKASKGDGEGEDDDDDEKKKGNFASKTDDDDDDDTKATDEGDEGDEGDEDKSKTKSTKHAKHAALKYIDQLAAKDQVIADLKSIIEKYAAIEAADLEKKKSDLLASYATLLTEEEIAPIQADHAQYSLDEIESKCAILYARKVQQGASAPSGQFQLNLNIPVGNEGVDLPAFMLQAMEIEESQTLRI